MKRPLVLKNTSIEGPTGDALRSVLRSGALGVGMILLGVGTLCFTEYRETLNNLRANSQHVLKSAQEQFSNHLSRSLADLSLLSRDAHLRRLLASNDNGDRDDLEAIWRNYLTLRGDLDQIRWIDETGRERLRMNAGSDPKLVPAEQLQDKSGRDYFQIAKNLADGEVYVGHLDLNIERGAVERPLKPTLRFATPVNGIGGEPRGILIFNLLMGDMLERLGSHDNLDVWMLNAQGYWLNGPVKEDNWGFALGKPSLNLAEQAPQLWKHLQTELSGQRFMDGALKTWTTFAPQTASPSEIAGRADNDWILLQEMSAREVRAAIWNHLHSLIAGGGFALLLWLAALGRMYLIQRQIQAVRLNFSREQLEAETLLHQAPDPMLTINSEGHIVKANRATGEFFGYTQDQLLHMNVDQLLPESLRAHHAELRHGYLKAPLPRHMKRGKTFAARLSSGEERKVSISLGYFRLPNGEIFFTATLRDVSDEEKINQEIKESRQRLSLATDSAGIGVWELDIRSGALIWDDWMYKIYGVHKNLFTKAYQGWEKLVHPDDLPTTMKKIQDSVASGRDYNDEFRIIRPSGEVRFVSAAAVVVRDDDGQTIRLIGTNQDVTDIKRYQATIRERENRLKEAQRLGRIGHWTLDLVSGALHWSDEIYHLFELDPIRFQASYEAFLQAIHPDDRARVDAAYKRSLSTREPYSIQHRLRFPDGRIKWVEERCEHVVDAKGEVISSVGTVQDITESHQAQEKLSIAASVFSRTSQAMIIANAAGEITDVNEALIRMSGYQRSEIIGRKPDLLSSDKQPPHFYEGIWQELAGGGDWKGDIWNQRKDGSLYLARTIITRIQENPEDEPHYVALQSDITLEYEHQQEIERLASSDALTGLYNRRQLTESLGHAMAAARRHQEILAVAFIDLDGFKPINDSFGHEAGDSVLRHVAQRLRGAIREADFAGRWGGDEFVVVLTSCQNADRAYEVAKRIEFAIGQDMYFVGRRMQVGASIGLALMDDSTRDPDDLVGLADQAMYEAKQAGRGCIRLAHGQSVALADFNQNKVKPAALPAPEESSTPEIDVEGPSLNRAGKG